MKKGICYGCVPAQSSVNATYRLIADAGFDGVEPPGGMTKADNLAHRRAADAAGIEIHSVMPGLWQCTLTSPKAADRKKAMGIVRKAIQSCKELGADAALVVPGVVNEQTCYEDAWQRSMACLKQLAKDAEKAGIRLAVENVWNKFLLSPIEFCRFIDEIGSDYVQAYFDVGNILTYGFPQQWIRSLGKRIVKIHVKDFQIGPKAFCWLLEGDVNWQAVMASLRQVNYDGYITAEVPPYNTCGEQMLYDTSRHLDAILGL